MSNRRKPTRSDIALHQLCLVDDVNDVLANLDPYRCPDCDSTFGYIEHIAEQVVAVQVQHDDTCPWLRAAVGP